MAKVTVTAEEAKKIKGKTDWEKLENMTDEELHQAAIDDPDVAPLSEEELKKFKRVVPRKNGDGYEHDKS